MDARTQPTKWPVHRASALALVLFSFFMSAYLSRTVFERLPHLEDEVAYLFQAKVIARGDLVIESPQPRRAFWQPFVVDYEGKRFGKYTPGWPALLATGVAMGEPWVVNAFFSALAVALVYRFGSELYNRDAGLIAAGLVAFSPMALLLNATLMGHTAALFGVLLFIYAYWRMERGKHPLGWGLVAGLALGAVLANRPLTAAGIALPFVAWSLVRLARALAAGGAHFWSRLKPLVALSVMTIILGASIPIYSAAATGDPTRNLYTLVWSYDTVGFGPCCGRSSERGEGGHNLERGVRHMRFDLSLMAADLFGWQLGDLTPEAQQHLLYEGDYYPITGVSWILLPFGLWAAFRRRALWVWLWLGVGLAWLVFIFEYQGGALTRDPTWSYIWLAVAGLWLVLPLAVTWRSTRPVRDTWSWLLVAVALGLIMAQLAYWIGSQRYSTRYYFEALPALALLSALPLAWLARRVGRALVYPLVAAVLIFSLFAYSLPRIGLLYRFNQINQDVIEGVEARREGDRPVLVLISGSNVRWRALGSLMAVTSPYLDSDIVAAWLYSPNVRDQILEQFPDRQIIEMQASENDVWFVDTGIYG